MLAIHLLPNPSPDDVKRAIATIGHWAGPATMALVSAELAAKMRDQMQADQPNVPPPPPAGDTAVIPPPPPPAAHVAAPELDADGLPWDERIHAGTKTKTADDRWKAKKGVGRDTSTYANVVGELRASFPLPLPSATAVPPPPATPAPVADSSAPVPPPPGGIDFPALMKRIARLIGAKKLTTADLNTIASMVGLNASHELAQHPDKLEDFNNQVTAFTGSNE